MTEITVTNRIGRGDLYRQIRFLDILRVFVLKFHENIIVLHKYRLEYRNREFFLRLPDIKYPRYIEGSNKQTNEIKYRRRFFLKLYLILFLLGTLFEQIYFYLIVFVGSFLILFTNNPNPTSYILICSL